jgi:hypothetical protein
VPTDDDIRHVAREPISLAAAMDDLSKWLGGLAWIHQNCWPVHYLRRRSRLFTLSHHQEYMKGSHDE